MVNTIKSLTHPQLVGVTVFPIGNEPERGKPQQVLVVMEAGVCIPLHNHEYDASMTIAAGDGKLLSDDEDNESFVCVGKVVEFPRQRKHGFQAGTEGLSFVSTNGGIVGASGWNIQFV